MNPRFALALLALLVAAPLAGSAALSREKAREEILILSGERRVALTVPPGFQYSSGKDERGLISARLTAPHERLSLELSFLPDPEGEYATARGRKELIAQAFQQYVGSSVEQAMRFEELDPRIGAGTYCVFTDANLVGKNDLPRGEYHHVTTGLKSWRGCFALFTLFSHDTTSDDYLAAMKLLRESVVELPLTPLL